MFKGIFADKRVLITGNTGFKGSWLTVWLLRLGARVSGIANSTPTNPSMFQELSLSSKISHHSEDIRNSEAICEIIATEKPDFIFHLAAQPIVSESYEKPLETFTTNVIGTANVLEALRILNPVCTAVFITSDKCYDNLEWVWGYRETDALGGKDIYSGSKGAAELVLKSYFHSFFKKENINFSVGIGRAGNVIGGGDRARDRIVADCVKAWSQKKVVEIRSPDATRPWQHVLEPLSGYLQLAQALAERKSLHGEAFNFGPRSQKNHTVIELLNDLAGYWGFSDLSQAYRITDNLPFHEAGLLKLNCDKALYHLNWQASLEYDETIRFVGEWYRQFYREHKNMFDITSSQIQQYEEYARQRNIQWAA